MKVVLSLFTAACAALICGCAATVPSELIDARQAYLQASAGPAAQLAPADLHKAQEALAQAEKSFSKDANSYQTRDLAYVAHRKAEMADAQASIAVEQKSKARADAAYDVTQENIVRQQSQELSQMRMALAASERSGEAMAAQLSTQQSARSEAEKQAAEQTERMQDIQAQQNTHDLNQTRAALATSEEQNARLEADKQATEQSVRMQDMQAQQNTHDLNQTRAALAASERSGEAMAAQLSTEQSARSEAEKRTTEQSVLARQMQEQQKTEELGQTRAALAASERSGEAMAAQLSTEHNARLDAETKSSEAQAELAKLAALQEDERGMVITLSGNVLFRSGEALLLPGAESRLNQVVDALSDRNVMVEGYTDSQGSEAYNLDLSQRRADAVRDYLVHRGCDAGRIQAHGVGEGRPIADNATAEGRANNRRVEIVLARDVKN